MPAYRLVDMNQKLDKVMKMFALKSGIRSRLVSFLMVCMMISLQACCQVFGECGESAAQEDVCAGKSNVFVRQDSNGLGITGSICAESENGTWIDGRCYCHGEDDGDF